MRDQQHRISDHAIPVEALAAHHPLGIVRSFVPLPVRRSQEEGHSAGNLVEAACQVEIPVLAHLCIYVVAVVEADLAST